LGRDANQDDIRKAYRRAALKWHPDKNAGKREEAEEKFKDIAEAYDVLRDPDKKTIYDQYGEEGLKGGAAGPANGSTPNPSGGFHYNFTGDPHDVFAKFFKDSFQRSSSFGESPFEDMGGFFNMGGFGGKGMGGQGGMGGNMGQGMFGMPAGAPTKRPALFDLNCTLEELYNGTTKKLKVTRNSITLKRDAETVVSIDVKPGWKAGTKVTYSGEGDEISGTGKAQDVVLVIREKHHNTFTREGSNLLHHTRIPLVDALTGCKVDIPTLDNRLLRVNISDVVTPTYTKIVKGEGMPSTKSPGAKGDLIITFDITYPKVLSSDAKEQISRIMPRS